MEFLINLTGRASPAGKRDVAFAVARLGFVHLRLIVSTLIVTLQPELVSQLTAAGAFYKIAQLNPQRTIIITGVGSKDCWAFDGYKPAIRNIQALLATPEDVDRAHLAQAAEYFL